MTNKKLTFRMGDANDEDVDRVIRSLWEERHENAEVRSGLLAAGLTEAQLNSDQPPLHAARPAEGIFPFAVILVVIVAPITVHAANRIFDELILPRLKDKFGGKGIGQQVEDKEADDD